MVIEPNDRQKKGTRPYSMAASQVGVRKYRCNLSDLGVI
jgi:hypothetical protein